MLSDSRVRASGGTKGAATFYRGCWGQLSCFYIRGVLISGGAATPTLSASLSMVSSGPFSGTLNIVVVPHKGTGIDCLERGWQAKTTPHQT